MFAGSSADRRSKVAAGAVQLGGRSKVGAAEEGKLR